MKSQIAAINHNISHIVAINIQPLPPKCEISRVRAMLLMGVAYIFTTILLLVDLPLNSINQHQLSNMKRV